MDDALFTLPESDDPSSPAARQRVMAKSVYPEGATVQRAARISECGRYRYSLLRRWGEGPAATFVMLNPSTADADLDDPTIRRCVGFARVLDCSALYVVNLYAWRATDPDELWKADEPVGPGNDRTLAVQIASAANSSRPLIAAWGANARDDRVRTVLAMPGAVAFSALHVTKGGAPGHPLYLPASARPIRWPA